MNLLGIMRNKKEVIQSVTKKEKVYEVDYELHLRGFQVNNKSV